VEIEYGVTGHADLKEWVAELQDEEDEMHANVLTPTNINITTTNNSATDTTTTTTTTTTTNPPPPAPSPASPAAAALNLTTQISTRCKNGTPSGGHCPC
jgi:hypothetical protein